MVELAIIRTFNLVNKWVFLIIKEMYLPTFRKQMIGNKPNVIGHKFDLIAFYVFFYDVLLFLVYIWNSF